MSGNASSGTATGLENRRGVNFQRMELKYCERCGALGVQQASNSAPDANSGNSSCGACRMSLQWLAGEVQR